MGIPILRRFREQSSASKTSPLRHASDRSVAPRQLPRRAQELGRPPVPVRVLLLRRRLARVDHGLRRHQAAAEVHPGDAHRLAGRRAQPGRRHAVRAVAGARARRAAPAAVHDHAAGLARTRAQLQGPAGAAQGKGPRHLRLPRLPAAADRRHPALQAGLRARGRGSGRARRDHARSRAPLQPSVWPRAGFRGQGRERHQTARRPQQHAVQAAAQEIPGSRRPRWRWRKRAKWSPATRG